MNVDRRAAAQVCIELLKECNHHGEISDASYKALVVAVKTMQKAEYWSLRNQEKHEGKNDSTDKQIAVSRVALPAIEAALVALEAEDFDAVIDHLSVAVTTEGKPVRKKKVRK